MAFIRERPQKSGRVTYQVTWKDPDTRKQETFPCAERERAEMLVRLLDANGNRFEVAEQLLEESALLGPTLAEAFDTHLSQLTGAEAYQIKRYRASIPLHFAELLDRKIRTLTPLDDARWIRAMQAKTYRGKPLKAKTIANHHGFLSAALATAVRLGQLAENPCHGVRLPKDNSTEEPMRFMTHEEWANIVKCMDAHFRPFFQLLIGTGLRFSEATALKAADFDLDGDTATVRVARAWKAGEAGGFYLGPPKSKRSRRTLPIAPRTVRLIRPLVDAHIGDGFVFRMKQNGVMTPQAVHNRAWRPALIKAGYRPNVTDDNGDIVEFGDMPRIHDIRHTYASWMLRGGMSIFELSRLMGHRSVKITDDRYSHLMPRAQAEAALIAERALGA
jgi:integrase